MFLLTAAFAGVHEPPATLVDGPGGSETFGIDVAGVGDIDGDGFGDVVVGASCYGGDFGKNQLGRACRFPGAADGLDPAATAIFTGPEEQSEFGGTVSGLGDVNGDGQSDVAVVASSVRRECRVAEGGGPRAGGAVPAALGSVEK